MGYKDNFKIGFDFVYENVKRKYPDIKFPCYGMRYYYHFTAHQMVSSEYVYFYLTENSLIYTRGHPESITEIPFKWITNLSIKQGWLFKSSFTVRFEATKNYYFHIGALKGFSTDLTGNSADNVKNFLKTLWDKC